MAIIVRWIRDKKKNAIGGWISIEFILILIDLISGIRTTFNTEKYFWICLSRLLKLDYE